jgi:8-oxo-dGTP diphosphatase
MDKKKIRFCPYCGSPAELRWLHGVERKACPACSWIYYEDPKVAAAVLVEQGDQVLLTQRAGEPFQGFWSLPAGFVDAYEDPARAAERECLEETGLVVCVTGLLDLVSGREHENGADILLLYRANLAGGELRPGDDAQDATFFSRANLPPLAFRATRKALGLE